MSGSDGGDWFGRMRPVKPAEPAEPAESAESAEPAVPAEVAVPTERAVASEVAEPAEVVAVTGPVPELVAALADAAKAVPEPPTLVEPASAWPVPTAEPVALTEPPARTRSVAVTESAASAEPVAPAEPTAPEPVAAPAEPAPDPRVRLRALTGGLADLSDAMAAIGIESVALRSPFASGPAAGRQEPKPAAAADFRVRCPDCGPQYVAVSDVRFVETGDGAEANRYLFTCPACGARVRRPAGPELAAVLKSSGVATLALRRGPGQAL